MSKIYQDRVWKNEKYPQELLAETRQRCQVTCFRVAHEGGLPGGQADNCLLLVTGSPRRTPVRPGAILREV